MENYYRKILLEVGYFVAFHQNAKLIISASFYTSSILEHTLPSAWHVVGAKGIFVGWITSKYIDNCLDFFKLYIP